MGKIVFMYIFAILVPPIGVAMTRQWKKALISLALTVLLWLPGAIYSVIVVNRYVTGDLSE